MEKIILDETLALKLRNYLQEEGCIERTSEQTIQETVRLTSPEFVKELDIKLKNANPTEFYEVASIKIGNSSAYDSLKTRDSLQITIDNIEQAIIMSEFNQTNNILDAGCGTGLEAVFLASLIKEGKVTGIDYSAGFIERSKERAKKCNLKNIEFKKAPLEEIPYSPHSFDGIICINALFEAPLPNQPQNENICFTNRLNELDRVLKPTGRLYLAIPNNGTPEQIETLHNAQRTGLKALLESRGYSDFKFNTISRPNGSHRGNRELDHSYFCMTKG